jgi:hypothetical protein
MVNYSRLYRITSLSLITLALFFVTSTKAHTATTSHLGMVHVNNDQLRNYDFTSESVSASNVDWPVNLFFWNNANVAKVKLWIPIGDPMYGRYAESGGGFVWDSDRGSKSGECVGISTSPTTVYHYRVYGRMYDLNFGYFVFATSHIDYNECGIPFVSKWTGKSEDAESHISGIFQSNGRTVVHNGLNFGNAEPYRDENGHIWQSNGLATAINIP